MSTIADPSTPTAARRARGLAAILDRKVVLPEHAGFDQARQAWNLSIDECPILVRDGDG
jgi:hypothetical protein